MKPIKTWGFGDWICIVAFALNAGSFIYTGSIISLALAVYMGWVVYREIFN